MDITDIQFQEGEMPPKTDRKVGFVYVGNDTWLPKALYENRKRQQRKTARKNESGVVWTR